MRKQHRLVCKLVINCLATTEPCFQEREVVVCEALVEPALQARPLARIGAAFLPHVVEPPIVLGDLDIGIWTCLDTDIDAYI